MRIFTTSLSLALLTLGQGTALAQAMPNATTSQTIIALTDLSAFKNPGKNWQLASDVWADYTKAGRIVALKKGTGILMNSMSKEDNTHLVTVQEFGDVELNVDFMMVKGSNSGVYLQGRYEIQLLDSWTVLNPNYNDLGGIYQRWDESRPENEKGYQGIAPRMNLAKAPGLWQHLSIRFRAPRFNEKGEKIKNARFEEVYLNGVLIHEQLEVTGPTRASLFSNEQQVGPLVFQGDHGNVAFRNISIQALDPELDASQERVKEPLKMSTNSPIFVNPGSSPYLLRSYLMFQGNKRTHVISVGNPNQTNYSYDLKQGSLLQFWRGHFVDATEMWEQRGEPQIIKPLGSVIALSSAPSLAVLSSPESLWPDSIPFEDLQNKGYTLDQQRNPTFLYDYAGTSVQDKITSVNRGESLKRVISVSHTPENLTLRLASAKKIESLGKGLYAIDDKSYYIQVDEHAKPWIRSSQGQQELLTAFDPKHAVLNYLLTW